MAVHYSDSELDPMSPCTLDEAAREQCSSDEDPAELGEPGWLGLSVEPRSHDDDDCNADCHDNEGHEPNFVEVNLVPFDAHHAADCR